MSPVELKGRSPAQSSRYGTLDGLRGIGALWVMLLHFAPILGLRAPTHGYLAVDLFFCLSGFVLTRSYSARMRDGMSFAEWIGVRLIRLYPLYFLSLVLGVLALFVTRMPASQLSGDGQLVAIATGLLMLPSPTWSRMPEMFPFNFVAWSLFIEMLLSVLFYWSSRWKNRSIWVLLAAGFLGLIFVRIFIGYIGGGFAWRDGLSGFARGLFSFSAGMLIARTHRGRRIESNVAWLPVIAAAILMSISPPHPVGYDLVVIIAAIPAITYLSVRVEPPNVRTMRLFGDLSYPVYALHTVAFYALIGLTQLSEEKPLSPMIGLAVLAGFLGWCWLLDRCFDQPIRGYASSALKRRVSRIEAP